MTTCMFEEAEPPPNPIMSASFPWTVTNHRCSEAALLPLCLPPSPLHLPWWQQHPAACWLAPLQQLSAEPEEMKSFKGCCWLSVSRHQKTFKWTIITEYLLIPLNQNFLVFWCGLAVIWSRDEAAASHLSFVRTLLQNRNLSTSWEGGQLGLRGGAGSSWRGSQRKFTWDYLIIYCFLIRRSDCSTYFLKIVKVIYLVKKT